MYSRVRIFGHPVHPMLVAFPVAFYTATLVAFIVYAATDNTFWFRFAVVTNWAGVGTALLAAIPGLVDWGTAIPKDSPAKATGLRHALLNVAALVLFLINAIIHTRSFDAAAPGATGAIVLSLLGLALTLPAGFLGWSLVQKYHVGLMEEEEPERRRRQVTVTP